VLWGAMQPGVRAVRLGSGGVDAVCACDLLDVVVRLPLARFEHWLLVPELSLARPAINKAENVHRLSVKDHAMRSSANFEQ
jgi:hypothetical protein